MPRTYTRCFLMSVVRADTALLWLGTGATFMETPFSAVNTPPFVSLPFPATLNTLVRWKTVRIRLWLFYEEHGALPGCLW